ncbi:HutD family protein [Paracrocinitomix mangrovi]|uniref:HutD family protein n=1 Tax=Paracrocinitomix mangrovi TaxID=2862509 RepID=UPI001C8DC408|nr:HutD family protein [Paracrocinitomix mangrovi]UKN01180.1 HutD family protein [Paracrocinitomix mangrovi]
MNIIRSNKTTNWGGGTTTELYIWPENATYKNRDFDFRLSTATVEVENAEFTPLPRVKRTLMVLDGQLGLQHEGQHSKFLNAFDQEQFDGGWKTNSIGTCIDFNLMCIGDVRGTLTHFHLKEGEKRIIEFNETRHLIYLFKGAIKYQNQTVEEGSLMLFDQENNVDFQALNDCQLVLIQISGTFQQ